MELDVAVVVAVDVDVDAAVDGFRLFNLMSRLVPTGVSGISSSKSAPSPFSFSSSEDMCCALCCVA